MNCQTAQELLIDLLYDELDSEKASAVGEHIAACDACQAEWEKLSLGLSLAQAGMQGEPDESPAFTPPRQGLPIKRWLWAGAAMAACLAAAIGVWKFSAGTSGPVIAAPAGPVELIPKGVSLTIMSQPPNLRGYYYHRDRWGRTHYKTWPGLALVRDERVARNLMVNQSKLEFANVPSQILPDSVRLRSLNRPGDLTILEQNYQYDLASASKILDRYIDQIITVHIEDAPAVTGRLLTADAATLVVQPDGEGPRNISRSEVQSISFGKLPEGLRTRPALLWTLDNRAGADHDLEVSYLSWGLDWKADYVLKITQAGKQEKDAQGRPVIYDTADIVGYATVTNNSGVRFEDAQLKLMAGDTRILSRPAGWVQYVDYYFGRSILKRTGDKLGDSAGFTQKSFFEYHLYTLGRPTTLADRETKQIEMLTASGVRMKRKYVYQPNVDAHIRVIGELDNSEKNSMGKPLPKGTVRLWAPGPAGVDEFIKNDSIDHTPKDEKIDFFWGHAFDLVGNRTVSKTTKLGGVHWRRTETVSLRNHKDYDVMITVVFNVPKSTYQAQCDKPWHVKQVGLVEVPVVVKANTEETLTFIYTYNTFNGGGLVSPYDTIQLQDQDSE